MLWSIFFNKESISLYFVKVRKLQLCETLQNIVSAIKYFLRNGEETIVFYVSFMEYVDR